MKRCLPDESVRDREQKIVRSRYVITVTIISKVNAQDQCVGIPIFARYAGRITGPLTVQTTLTALPKEGIKTP